jgi:hypothetical protein
MTESKNDETVPSGPAHESSDSQRPTSEGSLTSLRGASAVGVGRKFWLYAGGLALVIFAVVVVVSFLSAANDNARIERMKAHGIPVAVTVTNCTGNLGGSGSNGAGFTCEGSYSAGGTTFHEVIGSMITFASPGAVVHAVADPSQPGSVVLASAIKSSVASSRAYLRPGLLALVLIALALVFLRVARRSASTRRTAA